LPALLIVGFACLLVACASGGRGDGDRSRGSIVIAAAADLRFAFEEIVPLFERECRCSVEVSFGSSGNFATQIQHGLPVDVFFSANAGFIDRLQGKGLVLEGTRQLYAVGRIVLARNSGVAATVATARDLLSPEIKRIAIANPLHAPYGVAAQEYLTAAGVWDAVQPRLVLGENASQATQFVEAGDAQAGILPLSLAIRIRDKLSYILIDESQHTRLSQGVAVLKRSRNPRLATEFIAFVGSEAGREIMARYGFAPPL
jgi:molybdate transport system substrate-binding protein